MNPLTYHASSGLHMAHIGLDTSKHIACNLNYHVLLDLS